MDAKTGVVYHESNPDEALPPASISKMMTEFLVLEDVYSGK
jgi:serine-type D-Ala-D-Ala carboxypeptidase (penicillin-binding protein 5/6)